MPRTISSLVVVVVAASLAPFACRTEAPAEPRAPAPARTPAGSPAGPQREARPAPSPSPSATPAPAASVAEPARVAGVTAAHNRIREGLRLPPLEWAPELADYAQRWADKLKRRGCPLDHRPRSGPDAQRFGENIYSRTGPPARAEEVVDRWAAELADYDAKTHRCRGVCGHYTQIVWRDSRRLGCAAAACGETEVWVCNYDPPGNVLGERPY